MRITYVKGEQKRKIWFYLFVARTSNIALRWVTDDSKNTSKRRAMSGNKEDL
jgi:hypothetical protein